jgi:hypothetical protein
MQCFLIYYYGWVCCHSIWSLGRLISLDIENILMFHLLPQSFIYTAYSLKTKFGKPDGTSTEGSGTCFLLSLKDDKKLLSPIVMYLRLVMSMEMQNMT